MDRGWMKGVEGTRVEVEQMTWISHTGPDYSSVICVYVSLHHHPCIIIPASPSLHHHPCIIIPTSTSLHQHPCIILWNTVTDRRKVKQSSLNQAIRRLGSHQLFKTVNHALALWDTHSRPKGLFGGHLNIQSLLAKMDQIKHLVVDSNLDFLSEPWLHVNSPSAALNVRGYNMFRRDRSSGKGGGVMFYIKEHLNCSQIEWSSEIKLECIGLKLSLSSQMSHTLICVFRPPSSKCEFYDQLNSMLKESDFDKEVVLMGDFNVNWEDKSGRKSLNVQLMVLI